MLVFTDKNNSTLARHYRSGLKFKRDLDAVSKKKLNKNERGEQRAFISWLDLQKVIYFAIPNGGSRHKLEALNLKLDGVKSGVPDIFIPIANSYHHGLFIEMKRREGGKVSKTQQEWIDRLNDNGYCAAICNGWDQAKTLTEKYLSFARGYGNIKHSMSYPKLTP